MSLRWFAALAPALAALLLAACGDGGGGTDRTKAQLRLVNASDAYAALDLRVDDQLRQGGVPYGGVADYVAVDPSDAASEITRSGSTTPLLSFTPAVARDKHYTLLAYGAEGALRQLQIDDNVGDPDDGRTLLRVVNADPDAGALDVYLTAGDEALAQAVPVQAGAEYGTAGSLLTVNSATWRLRVTAGGSKTELRLDLPGLVLASRGIVTLVLTPGRGGVLLNALLVTQRGSIERRDTTQARVRVAAGVADSGAVSASVGGSVLMASVGSPAVGLYTLLPAGTQPVALAVNGTPLAADPVTLYAGADYTLLVRGLSAGAARALDRGRQPASGRQRQRQAAPRQRRGRAAFAAVDDGRLRARGRWRRPRRGIVLRLGGGDADGTVVGDGRRPVRAAVQRRRPAAARRLGVYGVPGRAADRRGGHPAQGPLRPCPDRAPKALRGVNPSCRSGSPAPPGRSPGAYSSRTGRTARSARSAAGRR